MVILGIRKLLKGLPPTAWQGIQPALQKTLCWAPVGRNYKVNNFTSLLQQSFFPKFLCQRPQVY